LLARTGATRNRLLREKNCRCLDDRSLARFSRVQPLRYFHFWFAISDPTIGL